MHTYTHTAQNIPLICWILKLKFQRRQKIDESNANLGVPALYGRWSLFPIPTGWYSPVMVLQSPLTTDRTPIFTLVIGVISRLCWLCGTTLYGYPALFCSNTDVLKHICICCGCWQHFDRSNLPYPWTTPHVSCRVHLIFLCWIIERRNFLYLQLPCFCRFAQFEQHHVRFPRLNLI